MSPGRQITESPFRFRAEMGHIRQSRPLFWPWLSWLEARSDMIELAEDDGTDGAARGGEAAPGTIPSKVGTYPLAAGPKK